MKLHPPPGPGDNLLPWPASPGRPSGGVPGAAPAASESRVAVAARAAADPGIPGSSASIGALRVALAARLLDRGTRVDAREALGLLRQAMRDTATATPAGARVRHRIRALFRRYCLDPWA